MDVGRRRHGGEEVVVEAVGVRGALPQFGDASTVAFTQVEDGPQRRGGLCSGLGHGIEEERQPPLPVALFADELQPPVVLVDVTTQVLGAGLVEDGGGVGRHGG